MSKIFCIGFHKTGTTSLAVALSKLGYSVTGPNGINDPDIAKNVYALADRLVSEYDAFQDNPWPLLYQDLDKKYPGSKFILTMRPTDAWIKSQVRHFGEKSTPMREWIYGVGCPKGNEPIYVAKYDEHNRAVLEYFKDRPQDFLVLQLSDLKGWDALCRFLGKEVPNEPFPHANKAEDREAKAKKKPSLFSAARAAIARTFNRS